MKKIRSEVTMTDGAPPWDDGKWSGYAWKVTLRYAGRRMTVPFFTGELAGEPTTADVVECLVSDSFYADMDPWEFAEELGYEGGRQKQAVTEVHPAIARQTAALRRLMGDRFDTLQAANGERDLAGFVEGGE